MKKIIILLLTPLVLLKSYSQSGDASFPKIVKDTLFISSGYKIMAGHNIQTSIVSIAGGDFEFIRRNSASIFSYNPPRYQAGLLVETKAIEQRGVKKQSNVAN